MNILTFIALAACLLLVAWWWQGTSALGKLEAGHFGPFELSGVSSAGDSYLAVDIKGRRIALVNNPTPEFDGEGRQSSSRNMTVLFEFSDVTSVDTSRSGELETLVFNFNKQVPGWNVSRKLAFVGGKGVRDFLKRLAPDLLVI